MFHPCEHNHSGTTHSVTRSLIITAGGFPFKTRSICAYYTTEVGTRPTRMMFTLMWNTYSYRELGGPYGRGEAATMVLFRSLFTVSATQNTTRLAEKSTLSFDFLGIQVPMGNQTLRPPRGIQVPMRQQDLCPPLTMFFGFVLGTSGWSLRVIIELTL
jgi:hypothetical protein